ncbi:MAG: iron-containing alcohol dehydrogenase family protein [Burkholderiaceae bacterium]
MQSFRHIQAPLRVFAGDDSLAALDKELARAGCRHAAILCGNTLAAAAELDMLRAAANNRLAGVIAGVRMHSPWQAVQQVAAQLADMHADAVIAVGGGSAMVSARAAVIALAERRPLQALCTQRNAQGEMISPKLTAAKLPIFAVPTTPSTAMIKPGAAVHDEASGARCALFDPRTVSQAVFLHPGMLMTAPPALVRSAALNSLTSAIEGLMSAACDRISEAMLIQATRVTAACLSSDAIDTLRGRADLAAAAILAGRGTENTGAGLATVIGHAMAQPLGIDGGMAKAASLPPVLRFNRGFVPEGRERLSLALGGPDGDIETTLAGVLAELGVPTRLRDLGVPLETLPAIADACLSDWFIRTNPRAIHEPSEILALLHEAW